MGISFEPQMQSPILLAGRLRHKIDIVIPIGTQDSTGGTSLLLNYVFANVWATVEAITGNEKWIAKSEASDVSHFVLIRYIGAAPGWVALTNYVTHALVKDSNGNLQQAQADGTAGATAPVWNTTLNGLTQDGDPSTGVVWKNIGPAPNRTGVNSAMQVHYQGRQFQITSVMNPDERNKMLILLCSELNDSNQQTPLLPGTPGSYNPQTLADVIDTEIENIGGIDAGDL